MKEFYIKKKAGFEQEVDGVLVQPFIYQPTPEGVAVLCEHYSKKYHIDLSFIDLRGKLEERNEELSRFRYLRNNPDSIEVTEEQTKGIILSNGQSHAVPIIVMQKLGKRYIIILDATSGACVRHYLKICELFRDDQIFLNSGSRQADNSSCITDAICILKEALLLPNLLELIQKKIFHNHSTFLVPDNIAQRPLFRVISKPNNFELFKMPEQLLLTAQTSYYLEQAEADLSVIIRGGRTLQYYRGKYRIKVGIQSHHGAAYADINSYLFSKSYEHKLLLDEHMQKELEQESSAICDLALHETSLKLSQ